MRKLLLLPALLLSTPAYAADQGDVQKLAQYGQCIAEIRWGLSQGGCRIPDSAAAPTICEALHGIALSREDG